jgi:hypothetical protein
MDGFTDFPLNVLEETRDHIRARLVVECETPEAYRTAAQRAVIARQRAALMRFSRRIAERLAEPHMTQQM